MQAWRLQETKRVKRKKKLPKPKNDLAIKVKMPTYEKVSPEYWPPSVPGQVNHPEYLAMNEYILMIDSSYDQRTIILDELTIEDSKIETGDPFQRPGKIHQNPSRRIIMDSIGIENQSFPLFDLFRKYFPGVAVSGYPPDVSITIRGPRTIAGSNEAVLLLDGNRVESDFMYNFPASEIAFVDLLTGGQAAIYGSDAFNGVIAFYTRTESEYTEEERMGILNFIYPGYYRAREFYAPDYEVPEEKHIKPDYRRTLYWNPSLTTDDQGVISFSFHTSDEVATYRVDVEGMTYSGIPFVHSYYFTVK
jgi:hypothetical protein